ncbi:MAG: tetratricopeptide repeat protein [Sandaracinus sp.]
MRYLCLNCEERFEHDPESKTKLRCPKCLRVTGLEKVGDPKKAAPAQNPWLVPGVVAALLAALVGGWAVWRSNRPVTVGDEVPEGPLEQEVLEAHLSHHHVDARPLTRFLAADDGIEALGDHAHGSNAQELAADVLEQIRARAEAGALSSWSMGVPRETPIEDAAAAWSWLDEDGSHRRLYPIEVAAIMASALRTRGVNAMLAEAFAFPGDEAPPDPSGHFGYFVVAVYDGEAGEGDPHYYDPYGGRDAQPEEDDVEVLDDVQVIGAALSLRALHLLVRESDAERALSVSQDALEIYPRSPTTRSVRGAILLAAGNAPEALQEFRAAADIREDAPRRNLLASMYLAQNDTDAANREVSAALEEAPDYAAAHGTLAAIHLASAEPDEALHELQTAERLDPDLHLLPGLWANYYAGTGELERAVEYARRAVDASAGDLQTRLMAARIYRMASRYGDMRREARAVLDATPSGRRDQMTQLIRQLLGPTALEDEEEEEISDEELDAEDGEDGEDLTLDGTGFQLSSPTLGTSPGGDLTLHDDEGVAEGEEDEAAGDDSEEGPALMLGDRSHFHLGGGGGGGGGGGDSLHLDLH